MVNGRLGNDKRLCRNVIIHGYCKYEGKGCEFSHSTNATNLGDRSKPSTISSVSVSSINAPEFVPRFTVETGTSSLPDASTVDANTQINEETADSLEDVDVSQLNIAEDEFLELQEMQPLAEEFEQSTQHPLMPNMNMLPTPTTADPYFMNHSTAFPRQPLQHHFYSNSLSHPAHLLPHQKPIQSFFIPDKIREELTQYNEAQWMTTAGNDPTLPAEVHIYHSLYPLEQQQEKMGHYDEHPATVYKATCKIDRRSYALVRIEGYSKVHEEAVSIAESLRSIRHCNIVSFRDVFITKAFGDDSLVFVYDYHPCAKTLLQHYFRTPIFKASHSKTPLVISEKMLWSYIVQISSAIKTVHSAGLGCRNIELNRILTTRNDRLRLSGLGILDILQGKLGVDEQQKQDLIDLGELIITLACHSQTIGNKDEAVARNDELERQLGRELENGRIVKLISKMGFINERPEFDMDPSWSETGDRYLIKLFRDYVFHQVDEHGQPVIDMVHVLTCLKKLDAGVDEKIMLMSRDEQSCLVVSFKEIKNCITSAFTDLNSGRK
ncbi:hypothetical protein RO3G_04307 [Rhizopus delemar RA 99-880]|uniref:PAN2-PAN3 deadenylation complex subunit PAN3 n=1 Tax=Rhizopus delemar (strain RA 99-880 / ATCC MYA-4621 / FGSC 9543 / NRRL 43880) TaxID=246409 RepID=I1BTS2_RHIO9|nr:hypothetical protein RO3G_04307 [Rhizopus delemar RA 99-880]|eukprot:EIE79602.1 hypothetical protein RO3G_04307 [Rhizopus delemar RA 99-880]